MASAPQDITRSLQAFASGFHEQGKRLTELQANSPAAFEHVVLSLLLEARDTARFRFLIAYLSSRGLLPKCVQTLRGVDPGLSALVVELAERMTPDGSAAAANGKASMNAELDASYMLGLLEAFSTGLNLLFIHARAIEGLDTKLRARLATILGKAARTHGAFCALVEDPDPRVRANAVEALWATPGRMAREIFEKAAADSNHRVAANALIGLYLQGEPRSIGGLAAMIARPDPLARAAAAWAMGRTGDARFGPLLQEVRRRPGQDPVVVRNCLAAAKRVAQMTAQGAGQDLALRILEERQAAPGTTGLTLSARVAASGDLARLAGTSFQIKVGEEPVWDYTCEAIETMGPLAVAFLLPVNVESMRAKGRAYRAFVESAFSRRKEADRIALALYADIPVPSPKPLFGAGPLAADPADIRETLGDLPGPANVAQGPYGPMGELVEKLKSFEGERHLVWVVDQLSGVHLESGRAPALGGVKLHAICTAAASAAASRVALGLARATGGACIRLEEGEDLAEAGHDLVASLHRCYRLTCPSPKRAERWTVTVATSDYQGRATSQAR